MKYVYPYAEARSNSRFGSDVSLYDKIDGSGTFVSDDEKNEHDVRLLDESEFNI